MYSDKVANKVLSIDQHYFYFICTSSTTRFQLIVFVVFITLLLAITVRDLYSSEEEEGHRGKAKKGSGERRGCGGARGGQGSEGLRWDPLHINSPDIDEMIRRGLGRQS